MTEAKTTRTSRWLSGNFEALQKQCEQDAEGTLHFDLVIVGSGYGGATAAAALAGSHSRGRPVRIALLERGVEYLPGMFPSSAVELPGHTRVLTPGRSKPSGNSEGLFDIRVGEAITTLTANGLGGSSLIDSGVMLEPTASIFDDRWPRSLRYSESAELLQEYFPAARRLLGASDDQGDNTILRHPEQQEQPLRKQSNLQKLADSELCSGDNFAVAPLLIAMQDNPDSAAVALNACTLCGDCTTGCNYNAKQSLDTTLLVNARQAGVEIYTGTAVEKLQPLPTEEGPPNWQLEVVHTSSERRQQQSAPLRIRCGKVILAAGALGSTEILLRSQSDQLRLSPQLGQRFSANGYQQASLYNQHEEVNAVAGEETAAHERRVGPTSTGIIDLRHQKEGLLLRDQTITSPLRRFYEEVTTTLDCLERLTTADTSQHLDGQPEADPWVVDEQKIQRTGIYALQGDDGSEGCLELTCAPATMVPLSGEGLLRARWPGLADHPLFQHQIDTLTRLKNAADCGGSVQLQPFWQPRNRRQSEITLMPGHGTLVSPEPLGGCPMGDDSSHGVVDHCGRVYDLSDPLSRNRVFDSLVIMDSSVLPSALGAPPGLTVAALALRSCDYLRTHWRWRATATPPDTTQDKPARPVYRQPDSAPAERETEVVLTERFTGPITLSGANNRPLECMVDITLRLQPKSLRALTRRQERTLQVNQGESRIRILQLQHWQELANAGADDDEFTLQAILVAPLSGSMEMMSRENSTYWERVLRAGGGWLLNHGLREGQHALLRWLRREFSPVAGKNYRQRQARPEWRQSLQQLQQRWQQFLSLASHCGEVRLTHYRLNILRPAEGWPTQLGAFSSQPSSLPLLAHKRFGYSSGSNPIRQLETLLIDLLPGLQPRHRQPRRQPASLHSEPGFMLHQQSPLMGISRQQDQTTALIDTLLCCSFFARAMLHLHFWSFRTPEEKGLTVRPQFPGRIYGGPAPEIAEIDLVQEQPQEKNPQLRIRLSRYRQKRSASKPPLVLIHGFSTSGAIFTHASIKPSLAEYFWQQGREVWVVDLRISAAMNSALRPWKFEDIAFADIPVAIDHICRVSGHSQLDIYAHCMGAALVSMAILAEPHSGDRYYRERQLLPQRIHRLVLSQGGPRMVFSPTNQAKARLLAPLMPVIPKSFYQLQRTNPPSMAEQFWDQVIEVIPYPAREFRREHPLWPWQSRSFAVTRHRLDALYGQTFNLNNVSSETLGQLGVFIGPLHLATVARGALHALRERITNAAEENEYVTIRRLRERWDFPSLSVHSDENRVLDIATLGRMQELMSAADRDFRTQVLQGFGHLDALIGRQAQRHFDRVREFLDYPSRLPAKLPHALRYRLFKPGAGPVIAPVNKNQLPLGLGFNREMHKPEFVLFLPVTLQGEQTCLFGGAPDQTPTAAQLMRHGHLKLARPQSGGWFKTRLPLNPSMWAADGILVLVIDDLGLPCEQMPQHLLPDNLFELIGTSGLPGHSQQCADYIREWLLSNDFLQRLQAYLSLPPSKLTDSIMQIPLAESREQLQLVLASCQYPGGMLNRGPAYASYRRLANHLDEQQRRSLAQLQPSLLVLTGDQVYVTGQAEAGAQRGLFDAKRQAYQQWLGQKEVRSVTRRLPTLTMMDQHENGPPRNPAQRASLQQKLSGKAHYINYQRPDLPLVDAGTAPGQPLWYQGRYQGFDYFVADTFCERDASASDSRQLMSEEQFHALEQWLIRTHANDLRPRFIVSPSALLPRRLPASSPNMDLHSWSAFPAALNRLLQFVAAHRCRNLVFLSGDEHLSSVARAELHSPHLQRPIRLYSIHSSALYAPFPHRNARTEDFIPRETFNVAGELSELACTLETRFFPGDGFALVSAYRQENHWALECEFSRESGNRPPERLPLDRPQGH
ncbi:alpha/beta fold hydrolase [Pseudomaricurvus sp. HS19]|uniref:alpha/beta fold hydrolase n=1 Tax=Pseudomaricurvus sp. HS19 TaxID=2692626 RepID=UPI00136FB980|nr:alpha/beta fold hydrolase [Pseudomaricurvus sp. HS19]MYM64557.1 alpha/beta fold hydrolase [Pseudomaricurvus sp. HS19]